MWCQRVCIMQGWLWDTTGPSRCDDTVVSDDTVARYL